MNKGRASPLPLATTVGLRLINYTQKKTYVKMKDFITKRYKLGISFELLIQLGFSLCTALVSTKIVYLTIRESRGTRIFFI